MNRTLVRLTFAFLALAASTMIAPKRAEAICYTFCCGGPDECYRCCTGHCVCP